MNLGYCSIPTRFSVWDGLKKTTSYEFNSTDNEEEHWPLSESIYEVVKDLFGSPPLIQNPTSADNVTITTSPGSGPLPSLPGINSEAFWSSIRTLNLVVTAELLIVGCFCNHYQEVRSQITHWFHRYNVSDTACSDHGWTFSEHHTSFAASNIFQDKLSMLLGHSVRVSEAKITSRPL